MIQPHIRVPLSLLRYFPLLILRIPLCQTTIYCSTVCMYLAVVLDNSRPMAGRMVYISGFGSMLRNLDSGLERWVYIYIHTYDPSIGSLNTPPGLSKC